MKNMGEEQRVCDSGSSFRHPTASVVSLCLLSVRAALTSECETIRQRKGLQQLGAPPYMHDDSSWFYPRIETPIRCQP